MVWSSHASDHLHRAATGHIWFRSREGHPIYVDDLSPYILMRISAVILLTSFCPGLED